MYIKSFILRENNISKKGILFEHKFSYTVGSMSASSELKDYFATAYRTGSDVWTHLPYHNDALEIVANAGLPKGALALDVGTGRGLWALHLAESGVRVIGIDYVPEIVQRNNEEVKARNIGKQLRFMEGDALDIPFTDQGFDLVTGIGVLQHLSEDEWSTYVNEVARVLKKGGVYLNVSLSRKTTEFYGSIPSDIPDGNLEKFGMQYHFFEEKEIDELFKKPFSLKEQKIEIYSGKGMTEHSLALVFSLFKKK
jgi:ubiquinone/menaquinone biosynthesis C-methylase UbiE